MQTELGALRRIASLREPELLAKTFQHLDELVPRICTELPSRRAHAIVGMAGLGKTKVAREVYERVQSKCQKHFFVTVGEQPDIMSSLRGVFRSLHPNSRVR